MAQLTKFLSRHLGSFKITQIKNLLEVVGVSSFECLNKEVIPKNIYGNICYNYKPQTEYETSQHLFNLSNLNISKRPYIGLGYHDCITPAPIQRHVIENPSWYTPYTPYQAECNQGKLENLMNYQTMVSNLTGMDVTNSSLLDLSSSYFEAILMAKRIKRSNKHNIVMVDSCINPYILKVLITRLEPLNIKLIKSKNLSIDLLKNYNYYKDLLFAILLEYPNSDGLIHNPLKLNNLAEIIHEDYKAFLIAATDPLALTLYQDPGSWGADIVIGSTQRFGLPLNFGGPHASFISSKQENIRQIPGKVVCKAQPLVNGNKLNNIEGYRMALQTREQHIRQDKATSNICTSQVFLAHINALYGVYHGPEGLINIATDIQNKEKFLRSRLKCLGYEPKYQNHEHFDTIVIEMSDSQKQKIYDNAINQDILLRDHFQGVCSNIYKPWNYIEKSDRKALLGISLNQTTNLKDIKDLLYVFGDRDYADYQENDINSYIIPNSYTRKSKFMTDLIFNKYHSETEFTRYIYRLLAKDLSLVQNMNPLGSCTMKLNSVTSMQTLSLTGFNKIHPYTPIKYIEGYLQIFKDLEERLVKLIGMEVATFQPMAGSHGEYTGLMIIRAYQKSKNECQRDIVLIPDSAHGTNFATAKQVGYNIKKVKTLKSNKENLMKGEIDIEDLQNLIHKYQNRISSIMITYPSTYGFFDSNIETIINMIHDKGAQVYLDGANMNAMVGLTHLNVDVLHLNLHKTFAIPHGGGGPGACVVLAKKHLKDYLPQDPTLYINKESSDDIYLGPISMTNWSNAGILPITYSYLYMLGSDIKECSNLAILNANYMATRLKNYYNIEFVNKKGRVSHEFILDLSEFIKLGITSNDLAKRLMDFGFHAPTMNWPVKNCFMIEPTESESQEEIDRYCDALIQIYKELKHIENKTYDSNINPIKMAPHCHTDLVNFNFNNSNTKPTFYNRPYSIQEAIYPLSWIKNNKYWPSINRLDDTKSDRHSICKF